ncbi:MAG: M56 family metallopeptidase [Opitutaceae bacterium]
MSGAGGEFFLALVRSSAAGGVLVGLVLGTQWLFRKQLSPRWACALWLLVAVRLLPFSFSSSSASLFNLFPSGANAHAPASFFGFVAQSLRGTGTTPMSVTAGPGAPLAEGHSLISEGIRPTSRWDTLTIIFSVWFAGVFVLSVHVLVDSIALGRRLSRVRPTTNAAALGMLQECCARLGVPRPPRLIETTEVASPAVYGLFRPRLLLPEKFSSTFSTAELRFVLLHELAHLRHRDLLLNWVMTTLQIVHWFNPLVWFAFSRWRNDRELACDAAALEAAGGDSNRAYGETMLRLLEIGDTPGRRPGLVGMLEDKQSLRRRVKMIAGFTPARPSHTAVGLFIVLAIVGLTEAQPVSLSPTPKTAPIPAVDAINNASVSSEEIDKVISKILADRFENDRSKFLNYLRDQSKTLRQYRQEIEQEIRDRRVSPAGGNATGITGSRTIGVTSEQSRLPVEQPPQVYLRIIQLKRNAGDTDGMLLNRAGVILARLANGNRFTDLATEFSDDARRSKGGDWGWVKRSEFREQFGNIAFNLGKGEVSAPILLPEGCFILFVEDRK